MEKKSFTFIHYLLFKINNADEQGFMSMGTSLLLHVLANEVINQVMSLVRSADIFVNLTPVF